MIRERARRFFEWSIYRHEQEKHLSKKHPHNENTHELVASDMDKLMSAVDHSDPHVRAEAAHLLQQSGTPEAVHALIHLLKDDHQSVRWAAMNSLIHLRHAAVRPLLEEITRDFHSSNLLNGACHVLNALHQDGILTPEEIRVVSDLKHTVHCIQVAADANLALMSANSN